MITVFVLGVGVRGDGLDGWAAARPVLGGAAAYVPAPAKLPPPAQLAANERRRSSAVTRLALAVAQEAAENAGLAPSSLRSVFGSANGDGATVHAILETLASPDGQVSPTQFHNSVHNAAAGYWSIGAGSAQPAACLGCHDATAAASLLAAAAESAVERQPVLLCLYDAPLPQPLGSVRPSAGIFGAGLVLAPEPSGAALARLQLAWRDEKAPPGLEDPHLAFGELAHTNPAARLLRLLEALATRRPDRLALTLLDGHVEVVVQPCSTANASSN